MSIQNYVCGFDEVGRGAIAGPVVVASVVFIIILIYQMALKTLKKLVLLKDLFFTKKLKKLLV